MRQRLAAVTAVLLVAGLAGFAVPAGATAAFGFTRIAGADRYATSALVAEKAFASAPTVLLATGANYPDALAASYLAGALRAPILLTTPDLPLSSSTTAALTALGAKSVIILGGTGAVSQAEQNQLSQLPAAGGGTLNVSRISGVTRYDTMEAIDTAAGTAPGILGGKRTAFLATGQNFPDALGAAPVSFAEKFPIVLSQSDVLSPQAAQTLTTLGIQQILVLGGSGAIAPSVVSAVNSMGITTLAQFAGVDRSATSTELATWAINTVGFKSTAINVASGDQAYGGADALSVGPLGGVEDPVATVVTDSVTNAGQLPAFAATLSGTLTVGTAIGGEGPLPDTLLESITNAAVTGSASSKSGSGGSGSSGTPLGSSGVACGTPASVGTSGSTGESGSELIPELTTVSLASLTTAAQATPTMPQGALLNFTFNLAVTGAAPDAADFSLTNLNGTVAAAAATTATVDIAETTTVQALFGGIDTPQLFDALGLASVAAGAVEAPISETMPPSMATNPEASAPIGGRATLEAGHTDAPDIQSFTGFRAGAVLGEVMVDITFDCDVIPLVTTGYHIVLTDDSLAPACTGPAPGNLTPNGGNVPGGAGTTVITVSCPDPVAANNLLFNDVPITQAEVARMYLDPGTVEDSVSLATNPLESAGTTATTGTFVAPDLTSASATPNTLYLGGTVDEVLYTFDQPVIDVALGDLDLFTQTGAELVGRATTFVSPYNTDQEEVLAIFPVGTLVDVVGAFVPVGAVHGAVGEDLPNQPESYGITGSTLVGSTNAPDLTSATLGAGTTIVYTFDKPPAAPVVGDFHLFIQTGLVVTEAGASGAVVTANNTVTVTFPSTTGAFLAIVDTGGAGNAAPFGYSV